MVPEVAPNTINSFITLANEGYYDGLIFHRIIKDFMIQGGDPEGTGAGGPGYTLKDEFFVIDELMVTYLSHTRGIISMAKTQAPNSAGSQFFITHGDSSFLDGQYSSFGYVVEGMDVVDALATVEVDKNDRPLEDVVIKTISVELNGYELTAPETISVQ
ncbi:MAG: peptidylprolyl isomerase [Clostridiales bacterium]|nr:peptidylprolyl isomerase [Clostridiales bacterium]